LRSDEAASIAGESVQEEHGVVQKGRKVSALFSDGRTCRRAERPIDIRRGVWSVTTASCHAEPRLEIIGKQKGILNRHTRVLTPRTLVPCEGGAEEGPPPAIVGFVVV
jgi:hypothetical protein